MKTKNIMWMIGDFRTVIIAVSFSFHWILCVNYIVLILICCDKNQAKLTQKSLQLTMITIDYNLFCNFRWLRFIKKNNRRCFFFSFMPGIVLFFLIKVRIVLFVNFCMNFNSITYLVLVRKFFWNIMFGFFFNLVYYFILPFRKFLP